MSLCATSHALPEEHWPLGPKRPRDQWHFKAKKFDRATRRRQGVFAGSVWGMHILVLALVVLAMSYY